MIAKKVFLKDVSECSKNIGPVLIFLLFYLIFEENDNFRITDLSTTHGYTKAGSRKNFELPKPIVTCPQIFSHSVIYKVCLTTSNAVFGADALIRLNHWIISILVSSKLSLNIFSLTRRTIYSPFTFRTRKLMSSQVKPVRLDDDTERYSWSRIEL